VPTSSVSTGSVGRFSRSTARSTLADGASSKRWAAAAGEAVTAEGAGKTLADGADDGDVALAPALELAGTGEGSKDPGDAVVDGPGAVEHAATRTAATARSERRDGRLRCLTSGKCRLSGVSRRLRQGPPWAVRQAVDVADLYRAAMPSMVTEHALVPDSTRSRVLVVASEPPRLPSWSLEEPAAIDSIREARRLFGIHSPYLRVVRLIGDPLGDETLQTLVEFDASRRDWKPHAGLTWLPLDDLAEGALETGPFAGAVDAWVDEVRSGVVPALRQAWARPGWYESTVAWLTAELNRHARAIEGPVDQLASWAISCVLGVETVGGRVIVKSVPPLFAHEPALTQALAARHPGRVPDVLGVDVERGHLLMAAFGGAPLGNEDASRWGEGLVAMAEIQKAWIGRRAEAEEMRVGDRTPAALGGELESIITDVEASPGLDPRARDRLVDLLPTFHDIIERLQAGPVPETLVHGDLHPWNVQRDDGRLVIFDWSDACWGHPFFDVPTFAVRTPDEAARETMRATYADAWSDFADARTLRALLADAEILSELHISITWRHLQAVFEPDVFPFVDSGVQRHLEYALAAAEKRV
jgi:phosphotransferase family enzyme